MNINRNNYETFFLLYVDKELCAADRKAVDTFVLENPDLQSELLLLQEATLAPVPLEFDKSSLLKHESIMDLQENLLLLGDKELKGKAEHDILELLRTDRSAAAEFSVLQQARLVPDLSIVFAGKQSLYKEEAGRVVGMKWWRMAAAAILLGFGIWGSVAVYENGNTAGNDPSAMAAVNGSRDTNTAALASVDTNDNLPVDTNVTAQTPEKNTGKQSITGITNSNTVAARDRKSNRNIDDKTVPARINTAAVAIKETNNLPKSYLDNINRKESNLTAITSVSTTEDRRNSGTVPSPNTIKNTTPPNTDAGSTTNPNAVYAGNTGNVNYLEEDDGSRRSKIGGLFRKVKRVIERTANVKPGEGLQIAGFEIAVK